MATQALTTSRRSFLHLAGGAAIAAAVPVSAFASTPADAELIALGKEFDRLAAEHDEACQRCNDLQPSVNDAWERKPAALYVKRTDGTFSAAAEQFARPWYSDRSIKDIADSIRSNVFNASFSNRFAEIVAANREWKDSLDRESERCGFAAAEDRQGELFEQISNVIERGQKLPASSFAGLAIKVRMFEWFYSTGQLDEDVDARLTGLLTNIKALAAS